MPARRQATTLHGLPLGILREDVFEGRQTGMREGGGQARLGGILEYIVKAEAAEGAALQGGHRVLKCATHTQQHHPSIASG
jgi:hypothetical protein